MTHEERIKQMRRCYSIYLWAYTLSVSGGIVNFDLDDESMEELGADITFAQQNAAALGARAPRCGSPYTGQPPTEPWTWAQFLASFKIEETAS